MQLDFFVKAGHSLRACTQCISVSVLLILGLMDLGFANDEVSIISIYDGKIPYRVVLENQSGGTSNRQPGIYQVSGEGEVVPTIEGEILRNGSFSGVIAQLELTKFDQRYASLFIVNNKLRLIQVNPLLSGTHNLLTFSELEVFDVNGNSVSIPDVSKEEDVSIFQAAPTPEGQSIIVSVRLKEKSILGDGVTFAFYLKSGKAGVAEEIQVSHSPTVISYQFHSLQDLQKLTDSNFSKYVISPLFLQNFIKQKRKNQSPYVVKWFQNLNRYFQGIYNSDVFVTQFSDPAKELNIPVLNLLTGDIEFLSPNQVSLRVGDIQLNQEFDFLTGNDRISNPYGLSLQGRVDELEIPVGKAGSRQEPFFHVYQDPAYSNFALAYINSELTLVIADSGSLSASGSSIVFERKLPLLPTQFSMAVRTINLGNRALECYFFVSTKNAESEKTVVYILSKIGTGVYALKKKLNLPDTFYSSDELKWRSNFPAYEREHNEILFDYLTPVKGIKQAYEQAADRTNPYLNLSRTEDREPPVVSYIEAAETIWLENRGGTYRKFKTLENQANQSGFQVFGSSGKSSYEKKGELLRVATGEAALSAEVYSKELYFSDLKSKAKGSVVAIDTTFGGGKSQFTLLVVISSLASKGSDIFFEPIIFEKQFPYPFSSFTGCEILSSKKKFHEEMMLVASFGLREKSNSTVSPSIFRTGVVAQSWDIIFSKPSSDSPLTYKTNFKQGAIISDESIYFQDILERILVDTQGDFYWKSTPVGGSQAQQITQMGTGVLISPERINSGQITFLSEDERGKYLSRGREKDSGFGALKPTLFNAWRVWGGAGLTSALGLGNDEATLEKFAESLDHFNGLEEALEQHTHPNALPKHEVFLVSTEDYPNFVKSIYYLLGAKSHRKGDFAISNRKSAFSLLDPKNFTQQTVMDSLSAMRESSIELDRHVLIGDLAQLASMGAPAVGHDQNTFLLHHTDNLGQVSASVPHFMYLLATEGRPLEAKDLGGSVLSNPKISMVLVSTPEKWFELGQKDIQEKSIILSSFNINKKFLSGSWKVSDPKSPKFSEALKKYRTQPISSMEKKVFPAVDELLEQLSDLKKAPKHQVLLVPRDLKALIKKMIFSGWLSDREGSQNWSYQNPLLSLYNYLSPDKILQHSVLENFEAMVSNSHERRTVLVADLQDVFKADRPALVAGFNSFTIGDSAWNAISTGISDSRDAFTTTSSMTPHFLYLLATEGQRVAPEDLISHPNQVSVLLYGDVQDWENIKKELHFESRYSLAETFEKVQLESPSLEAKKDILREVNSVPEIKRLGYRFEMADSSAKAAVFSFFEDSEGKLLGYLVNRCETLARQFGFESTTAFIKLLTAYRHSLVEDPDLRSSKIMNRSTMERLLSRVFSIPLNLNTLPPEDPYVQLSHPRAALRLQEVGYRGPLDLKNQVIQTLLAPTRNDPTRSVPGSIIVFGDSSTGKTMLFQSMMKMLGLKEYRFSSPDDEDAGYMVINVGKLTSQDAAPTPDVMTVKEALKHLSHFLSLPRGYRGHILFDDLHKGDQAVVKAILKFLQSLFDAEQGIIRVERMGVRSKGEKIFEIPVRNIHPWVTLNPTQDQKKLERYTSKDKSDVDVVVATLSSDDNPIEKSFLMRWGLILNVSRFPLDAKAPSLSDSLRSSARNDFNVQGKMVLVSPLAVNQIVAAFPQANARDFLSSATSQLLQIPQEREDRKTSSIFVVMPRGDSSSSSLFERSGWMATGRQSEGIESFVQKNMVAIPINQQEAGKLGYLSVFIDVLRTHVYSSLVSMASQKEDFSGTALDMKNILAPFLHGITHHLKSRDYLPLGIMNLDAVDFLWGSSSRFERENFYKKVSGGNISLADYFKPGLEDLALFVPKRGEPSRAEMMLKHTQKVGKILEEYLSIIMRVPSIHSLPSSLDWISALSEKDPLSDLDRLGDKMVEEFRSLWADLYLPELIEMRGSKTYEGLDTYDVARLFALIIDSAMTHLPWGNLNQFMLGNLSVLTSDLEVGQRSGVQFYLFNSKASFFKPETHELIFQLAGSSQAYREWTDGQKLKKSLEFESRSRGAFDWVEKGAEK